MSLSNIQVKLIKCRSSVPHGVYSIVFLTGCSETFWNYLMQKSGVGLLHACIPSNGALLRRLAKYDKTVNEYPNQAF